MKIVMAYERLTAVVDTREQRPLDLSPMSTIRKKVEVGDYTLLGLEDILTVERKDFADLLGCMTSSRERFEKVLAKMKAYPFRCVVIEGSYGDLAKGKYRSKMNPMAAMHTISSWTAQYQTPFMFLETPELCSDFVKHFMHTTAYRIEKRLRSLNLVVNETRSPQ